MSQLLFFSGGTALRMLSRELAARSISSTHLVTTFDSGGSSKALREAFHMPAPGDLRNRLLALAPKKSAAVVSFLEKRLGKDKTSAQAGLESLRKVVDLPGEEYEKIIRDDLKEFFRQLPDGYDPVIASYGNMALTGAYLKLHRNIAAAVQKYAVLLDIVGEIIPICRQSLHLTAILANGQKITRQHLFKTSLSPIRDVYISDEKGEPSRATLEPDAATAIVKADIICYPMGSFFSSIIANLLVPGVGRKIADSDSLKLFIPNTGHDPELDTLSIPEQVKIILAVLRRDAPLAETSRLLHSVVIDPENGQYNGDLAVARRELAYLKIGLVEAPLISPDSGHDPVALATWLEKVQCKPSCLTRE